MRALFLCARSRRRSPTVEHLFANWPGVATRSAGLASDAETPLEPDDIAWTDIVFVMEARHKRLLTQRYPAETKLKKIVVLGIPDDYEANDPDLIARLTATAGPHLRRS